MHIWVVCWLEGSNVVCEVFTDIEQATQCMRYMAANKSGVTVKHIEIQKQEEPAAPEEPVEEAPALKAVEPEKE